MTGREGEGNGEQSEWNGIGQGGIRDRGISFRRFMGVEITRLC